jgi:cytochrome b pre-mRNA-processing protein 3
MSIIGAWRDLIAQPFDPATTKLYGVCVAAARQPVFYARFKVPDTIDGRFNLLVLHILLAMLRLTDSKAKQRLFDLMFADMERSLREMGVGDMSIGKKMKPMLIGFYGRANAYQSALAESGDDALLAALSRNLYGMATGTAEDAQVLADYMRASAKVLATQNEVDILQGALAFPAILQ